MLERLDALGIHYNFKFNKSKEFKTITGAFISILYYIIVLITCFFFTKKFLDTTNPELQRKEIRNFTFPEIKVNQDQFYSYVRLREGNDYIPINQISSYVDVYFFYGKYWLNENPSTESNQAGRHEQRIEGIPCKDTIWYKETGKDLFNLEEQKKIELFSLCYDDSKTNITLFGGTNKPPWTLLSVVAAKCALGSKCLKFEEIKNSQFIMGFYESRFDVSDYDQPLKLIKNEKWKFGFLEGIRQDWRVLISTVEVLTDVGWFRENLRKKAGRVLDIGQRDSRLGYPGGITDGELIVADIYSSNRYLEYKRTYFKIIDIFSGVGGVLELVIFFLSMIYSPVNYIWLKQKMILIGIMNKKNKNGTNWINKIKMNYRKGNNSNKELNQLTILDNYNFNSTNWIDLISKGILQPKGELEKIAGSYYKNCADQLQNINDVYKMIEQFNQLFLFKNVFLTMEQRKLAPYVAITKNQLRVKQAGFERSMMKMELLKPKGEMKVMVAFSMLKESYKKGNLDDISLGLFNYFTQKIEDFESREENIQTMIRLVQKAGFLVLEDKKQNKIKSTFC